MELTMLGLIGLGFIGGFLVSLYVLDLHYRINGRIKIDKIAKQYVYMLKCFGIKKGRDGVWRMHPLDKDEIWIKKE